LKNRRREPVIFNLPNIFSCKFGGTGVGSADGLSALDRLKLLLNNNEDVESLVPHVAPPSNFIDYDSIPVGRKSNVFVDYLPHAVQPEETAEAASTAPVQRSESANSLGSGQSAFAAVDSVKRVVRPAPAQKTSKR
jgi:hypothetical protein